jgi:hypothetical protein
MLRGILFTVAVVTAGCSRHRYADSPPPPPGVPEVSEIRTADSLHQLLSAPVVNDAPTLPEGDSLRQITIPDAQILAADGHRYTMFISDRDQLVWINKTGGIGNHINELAGPWSIENRNVVALLSEVAECEAAVEKNRENQE